jgi:hypothetical protein
VNYFQRPNDKAWNGITPHYPKRESRKQYPLAAKLWEMSFGIMKDSYCSTFWKQGETINASRYVQTHIKLCRALHEKRPKKKAVILQHDNARPYITRLTLQTTQKNG